jgi:hypothetical protein
MRPSLRTPAALLVALGLSVAGAAVASPASAATATRTVLSTGTPTIGVGQNASVKAVVKPVGTTGLPTGNVVFKEGTTVLATVALSTVNGVQTAKATLTGLTLGAHSIVAAYTGTATWAASTSLPVTITVTKPATTTGLRSQRATPTFVVGEKIQLIATVKQVLGTVQPTGGVTFNEGATVLGTSTLSLSTNGLMTAKISFTNATVGTHSYTATYGGSASFEGSTSKALLVTVDKAQSLVTLTSATAVAPNNARFNVKVTAVAPGTGVPTGTVTMTVTGFAPQTFQLSSTATAHESLLLVSGTTYTVTASYSGDSRFQPGTATIQYTQP